MLVLPARPAAAVGAFHNYSDPPPACTTPYMRQDDGNFPNPIGAPYCAELNNAAVSIDSVKVLPYQGVQRQLVVATSGGSVTVHGVPHPTKVVLISNYSASQCLPWSPSDPMTECFPDIQYVNDSGGGGGGDEFGTCESGGCKLVFTPVGLGTYRHWFRLTVIGHDSGGYLTGAADAIVYVDPSGNPPTAAIRPVQSDTNPFQWTFDGSNSAAQETGRTITAWAWDFGDGKTGTGASVDHTFAKSGLYTVTLTVTDSAGATGSTTYQANVSPLVVRLNAGVTNGKVFSVDVTVKNADTKAMTGVHFADPAGIVQNTAIGDPATAGKVAPIDGPTPDLPGALAAGASATATVTFDVEQQGGLDLVSEVSATDAANATQTGDAHAIVQIGRRAITEAEFQRIYSDALFDGSQSVGALLNAAKARLGLLIAWAAGSQGTDTAPSWLTGPITGTAVPPPGTQFADTPFLNVSAARVLGLDDNGLVLIDDKTPVALSAIVNFADHFTFSSGKVIDDSGNAAYVGLKNAGEFYGQLASGDQSFRAEAARQLNGMIQSLGEQAKEKITLIGAILAFANEDPVDIGTYEKSPVLQKFSKDSADMIDAGLKTTYDNVAHLARLAKNDPVAASGQLGDTLGTTLTGLTRDVALAEVGGAGISRLGGVMERSIPFARTGASIDGGLATADPATQALRASLDGTGQVVVRQSLESLGEGATLTPAQLEQLGGFYAADAQQVQKIINEVNQKYGVNIELQVRPGNPASLELYKNGLGVPKPEWVKPKNTEWMDLVLGAPQDSLGKATVFEPVRPSPEVLAKFSEAQQQTILDRYETQVKIYQDATQPGGKFAQLLADSQNPEGATVTVGIGTGERQVTGLKYSLKPVGDPAQKAFVVVDDAAGGKFVLSDADYQAVVDANTGMHLPAGKRGQIELEVMSRLGKETVSFGGHGWSHSGFDLASKYSESFIKFVTESSSPAAARRTLDWFVSRADTPAWLQKIITNVTAKLGHAPSSAELVDALLDLFRPGNFVIKFNGAEMRVGYGAGIR